MDCLPFLCHYSYSSIDGSQADEVQGVRDSHHPSQTTRSTPGTTLGNHPVARRTPIDAVETIRAQIVRQRHTRHVARNAFQTCAGAEIVTPPPRKGGSAVAIRRDQLARQGIGDLYGEDADHATLDWLRSLRATRLTAQDG